MTKFEETFLLHCVVCHTLVLYPREYGRCSDCLWRENGLGTVAPPIPSKDLGVRDPVENWNSLE